ncbi:AbfB domain-containing protein [Actinosynnema sp. ALI-1.44]|uniref:AbfB domain-containing protein n=1 Tax=Actinosynnema sp. ALI-1.44 TaxID=1933779 RepID=UPI00143DF4A5|nr:AbfB domain-containing protein [Actinosynnema sp. ALI-1.44]
MNVDVAVAAGPSTEVEKGTAAALLGVTAGQDLLDLSDRDFTSAMYRIADEQDKPRPTEPEHQKVKQAAIDALTVLNDPACAPCTTYIKTGMAAAHQEDVTIVNGRRQQQETERKTKVEAARTIGLTEDKYAPELGRTVHDFIVFIDLNADNHKDIAVHAAAQAALRGSAEKQWSFLAVEIFTAHKDDVARLTQEDTEKTQAEKDRIIAEEKKATAAYQSLGIVADDKMRKLNDDDFCRTIYRLAPKDSEVFIAARDAVLSLEPTDRTKFIETGAADARQRDIDNELRRRDQERVKQITAIRDAAKRSFMHPDLVDAANVALAGTSIDRERFLRVGQYQRQAQSLRVDAWQGFEFYLTEQNGDAVMAPWKPGNHPEQSWKIEPGLGAPECFSFQSVSRPNHYLHWRSATEPVIHRRMYAHVDPTDGTPEFAADATWCVSGGAEQIAIHPLKGSSAYLYVTGALDDPSLVRGPAWHVEAPNPPLPMDRRYSADKNLRDNLGKPIGDAVLDANNLGYKEYEKGRLYLTAGDYGTYKRVAVQVVYNGPILDKLLSLGGPNPLGGVFSDQVPTKDGKGQVVRIAKPTSGGQNLYIMWSPSTGAHIIYGTVGDLWTSSGAETGPYGYPLADPLPYGTAGIVYQRYVSGSIYYVPNSGIRQVTGEIHKKFAAVGFEAGMGVPLTDETKLDYVWRQTFEKGRIDKNTVGAFTVAYSTVTIPHRAIQFKGVQSGRCVQMAGTQIGAAAELRDCSSAPSQVFDVISRSDNKYVLKNRESGKCLVHLGSAEAPPILSQDGLCTYTWEFTTAADNTLALRDRTGLVIEAKGSATANGTQVIMAWDVALPYMRWTVIPVN